MPRLTDAEIEYFAQWRGMTVEARKEAGMPLNEQQMKEKYGLTAFNMKRLKRGWQGTEKPVSVETKEYDSDAWLRDRTQEADKALMKSCADGNAQSLKLFNQLMGRLVEKQETKVEIGLSAAEHIRIAREADRRISELNRGANGDTGILEECPLLPLKVCLDREQEYSPDG